jgi:uncharacterized protein
MNEQASPDQAITSTRRWLERAVIGLNLCPFAKAVHLKQQIRWVVSMATDTATLRDELARELAWLRDTPAEQTDTTLLIHPLVLKDFNDYNDFLDVADAVIADLGLEGELQIASFHPDYQFAGNGQGDIDNYSNRAPFPTLHLLRESSIERAVAAFPDAADIYERNIDTLQRLGHAGWARLWVD